MQTFYEKDTQKKIVLCVGDSYFIPNTAAGFFQGHGYEIRSVGSHADEIATVRFEPEIVIVDFDMVNNDPYLAIAVLHHILPTSHIFLKNGRTRHCNEDEALSAGAEKILDQHCGLHECEEILMKADYVHS